MKMAQIKRYFLFLLVFCILKFIPVCPSLVFSQSSDSGTTNEQSKVASSPQIQPSVEHESIEKGMELFKSGEYEKALDEFLSSQIKFPDDPDIPFFIGMTYLKLTLPGKAVPYFKTAIDKDPTAWDAFFQLGTALVSLEKFDEALNYLERLYRIQPKREDMGCLLGMACYGVGRYDDALHYLETGVNSSRMKDVTATYIGLTRVKLGKGKIARMGFGEMNTLDPTSPLLTSSRRLSDVLAMEEAVMKPYKFFASFRTLYDDNVSSITKSEVFRPATGKEKSSIGESLALQGEYSLIKVPKLSLNISYGLNQTVYQSAHDFDVQAHTPGLNLVYKGWQVGPIALSPRLDYFFNYILLDYRDFLNIHTVRPSVAITEWKNFLTVFSYNFDMKDYQVSTPFSAENPDATSHEVGLTQYLRSSGGRHYLRAGCYKRYEVAEGDDFDFEATYFRLGAQYTLPKGVRLNADYSWEFRDFSHDHLFFGEKREDVENVSSISLSKDIFNHITIFGDFLNRECYSNLSLFGFEKNVYAVGISCQF